MLHTSREASSSESAVSWHATAGTSVTEALTELDAVCKSNIQSLLTIASVENTQAIKTMHTLKPS